MAPGEPIVLEGIRLLKLVEYVLQTHSAPSRLIVCCSGEIFMRQLLQQSEEARDASSPIEQDAMPQWTSSTLQRLAMLQNVRVVFCPSAEHLRAYLSKCTTQCEKETPMNGCLVPDSKGVSLFAVLNLFEVHRSSSSWSAQGLNRTLGIAVEAAWNCGGRLVLAECRFPPDVPDSSPMADSHPSFDGLAMDTSGEFPNGNLWDEEISILNVSTKHFRAGADGWAGRTVRLRDIAQRWCRFERFED